MEFRAIVAASTNPIAVEWSIEGTGNSAYSDYGVKMFAGFDEDGVLSTEFRIVDDWLALKPKVLYTTTDPKKVAAWYLLHKEEIKAQVDKHIQEFKERYLKERLASQLQRDQIIGE